MKWNEKKPPKVEDFVQIRLFVYFGTKSSTFGAFFLKILHFWLRKLEKPPLWEFFFFLLDFLSKLEKPPLLVVFFSKVRISFRIDFQSSTFGVFFSPKSSTFGYENLDLASLRAQQGARTLQNHYPAYFFDAPYQSCKFCPDWSTLIFFCSKGTPFASFFVFGRSDPNKVQANFKITSQLIFLMVPTSPASFVQIGELWIFFIPRVPPLDNFRNFDKMQKSCIFCFWRYGPHFLTRYSGLPQEQF